MDRSPTSRTLTSAPRRPASNRSLRRLARMFAAAGFRFLRVLFINIVTALLGSAEIKSGIIDAVVEDPVQDHIEAFGDLTQVLEREIAHTELVIEENTRYDAVDQALDALGSGFRQRARGGFDGVCKHDDRRHLGPRTGPRIAVVLLSQRHQRLQLLG